MQCKLATLNDLGVLRHMLCSLLAELNVSVIIFVRELGSPNASDF